MKCPNCDVSLVMTDRSGVEIDYCPDCRGIWLDRGELDKIIERSSQDVRNQQSDSYQDKRFSQKGNEYQSQRKRKDSFLGDLFDF